MLRDDISLLLTSLINITENKLDLFNKICQLDYDCIHYINAGDIEEAGNLLKKIEYLRHEIDTLNYESGTVTDKLLTKMGINKSDFDRMIENENDDKFSNLRNINGKIKKILTKLIKNRENLIMKMKEINRDIGIDIRELQLMSKYDIDKLI